MSNLKSVFTLIVIIMLVSAIQLSGQPSGDSAGDFQAGDRGGDTGQRGAMGGGMMGGRGGASQTVDVNDTTGFTQIFDGQTFDGWDLAEEIWSIEDGALVATSTSDNPAGTTFAIYEDSELADFELKLEFKIEGGGNGGVQYRSWRNPNPSMGGMGGGAGQGTRGEAAQGDDTAAQGDRGSDVQGQRGGAQGDDATQAEGTAQGARGAAAQGGGGGMGSSAYSAWNVAGYQYDIGGSRTGCLWEGGRFDGERNDIAGVGQIMSAESDGSKKLIATFSTTDEDGQGINNDGEWNYLHIIAKGNTLIHMLNGRLASITIDNNTEMQKMSGVIGLQIEGTGMTMSYRNIWLKKL